MPRLLATADSTTLAALVAAHGARVYSLCRRLDPDADDAYQAVWEKVWLHLDDLDPERGSTQAWLVTLTHRTLIDRHRRRRSQGVVVPLPDIAEHRPSAPALIHAAERRAQLETALSRLPESWRRVVVLHHLEGEPLDDIAAREGVPVGTVKSRLHRGRARLAQWLHPKETP